MMNDEVDWNQFNSVVYFENNYEKLQPIDIIIAEQFASFISTMNANSSYIDVGTGTNIYPAILASRRVRSIDLWEVGQANVEWLEAELSQVELRPTWKQLCRRLYPKSTDIEFNSVLPRLKEKCHLSQKSIFELPSGRWDVASMFFCAESITGERAEFELALQKFMECLTPDGSFFCAFMENSAGYQVGKEWFPATKLSLEEIEHSLSAWSENLIVERIGEDTAKFRTGYSNIVIAYGQIKT